MESGGDKREKREDKGERERGRVKYEKRDYTRRVRQKKEKTQIEREGDGQRWKGR